MDWSYDAWPSGEDYDWGGAARGQNPHDQHDFHVDLGCGRVKKGRIGIDHAPAPGVNVVMDLNTLNVHGLPVRPGEDAALSDENRRLLALGRSWPLDGGDLEVLSRGLPFETGSIESIISHHLLEHVGTGFLMLINEVYRVLRPGGLFRAVTPLYPSKNAVEDPDHVRYFMDGTWDAFCGTPGDTPQNCWQSSFAVPYTTARFHMMDKDMSPPTAINEQWGDHDAREIRVALKAMK